MKNIVHYQTEKGESIFIEVESNDLEEKFGMRDVGALNDKADQIISAASGSFERSLDSVFSLGELVIDRLKTLGPQKVEVEFGVTFSAEVGAIISSIGGEANFKINLSWENGIVNK